MAFKKNNIFSLIFITLSYFLIATPAFAFENYPPIPGLVAPQATCTTNCLSQFVGYFFGLGIYTVGALAVLSIAFAGIQLMIGTLNPEGVNNAKDRIKGSLFGVVLMMISYILIQTVNSSYINSTLPPLPGIDGIYYTNGSEDKPSPVSEADTSNILTGFNNLKYICTDATKAPKLLVTLYPAVQFGEPLLATEKEIACNAAPLSLAGAKSYKTKFKVPGVYFYSKPNCQGISSEAITSDTTVNKIDNFLDVKSIKIVNKDLADPGNPASGAKYGIIMHSTTDYNDLGKCQKPILTPATGDCENVNIIFNSAHIFSWNKETDTGESSGDGVNFYSNPFGWKNGARAGQYDVEKTNIDPNISLSPANMEYDYTFSNLSSAEQETCKDATGKKTFAKCPDGSIENTGNYLVALYDKDDNCIVYSKSVENLNTEKSTQKEFGNPVTSIEIIATR